MKRIISWLLLLSIVCTLCPVFSTGAAAVNKVNTAYIQENLNDFVTYLSWRESNSNSLSLALFG